MQSKYDLLLVFPPNAYKYPSLTIGITIAFGIRKKKRKTLKNIKGNFIYLFVYLLTYLYSHVSPSGDVVREFLSYYLTFSPYSLFHAAIRTSNWTGENLSLNRPYFFYGWCSVFTITAHARHGLFFALYSL